jgi:hypothetical protein
MPMWSWCPKFRRLSLSPASGINVTPTHGHEDTDSLTLQTLTPH